MGRVLKWTEEASWKSRLLRTRGGHPKRLLANAITALREAPEWAGVLTFDELSLRAVINRAPPWEYAPANWTPRNWNEPDDLLLAEWLQQNDIEVSPLVAAQAVDAVSRERSFHPICEYLESLVWDGKPRIGRWTIDYLGAVDTPFHREAGKLALIAAVARVYQPGCKVDHVPVLEGVQGSGKSSALATLFGEWHSDDLAEMGEKDAAMQIAGAWCLELSELASLHASNNEKAKAFITRRTDRYRPPYGRRVVDHPRSCTLWGTTNSDVYLDDPSGGRRYWPIKTGQIDLERLRDDRDQLWAEAKRLYEGGHPWHIYSSELRAAAADAQDARYNTDPWEEAIAEALKNTDDTSSAEILEYVLKIPIAKQTQRDKNRVASCLQRLGFEKYQKRDGTRRSARYRREPKPLASTQ